MSVNDPYQTPISTHSSPAMRSVALRKRGEAMNATRPTAPDTPTTDIPRYWAGPPAPSGERTPLLAGTTIADGRIRLLIFYGDAPHLQFWQAADTLTGQHLAVTVVDPERALPSATVDAVLADTASLRGI